MKKIFTNPVTYVALAVAAVIVYLIMKDSGLKLTTSTTTGSTAAMPAATTIVAATA